MKRVKDGKIEETPDKFSFRIIAYPDILFVFNEDDIKNIIHAILEKNGYLKSISGPFDIIIAK